MEVENRIVFWRWT